MLNLLNKEFKVSIQPVFYIVVPLLAGALILIPGWLYFIVFLYFAFITLPNLFASYKTQNDLFFSSMLPVCREDIVRARINAIVMIELIHILLGIVFAVIHSLIYKNLQYIFMKPNLAFFGMVFVLFALINIGFFPLYFRSAYKYGWPTLLANVLGLLFAIGMELLVVFNHTLRPIFYNEGGLYWQFQWGILIGGILLFVILNLVSTTLSVKSFEKVDIN